MSLKDIVNVTITRQATAVSRAGFGVVNILGVHKRFTDLVRYYSSLDSVADDFESSDLEYVAARAVFSQNPVVTQIAISRRETGDNVVVTVTTVANSTLYTTTINGTVFSFTSDSSATAQEIAAGLVAAINAGAEPVTASDNLDGTYDLDPDVAGVPYSLTVDDRQTTAAFTTVNDIDEDLDAIKDESNDWYGLIITTRTQADVETVAAWTEAQVKIFLTASADADIIDTTLAGDTTTIAAVLKTAAYARSGVFYHPDAATTYPEAALFGKILPYDPGSYTAMFKTLAGVAATVLTDTQVKNARDKNCMVYQEVGGVNITWDGKVADGEFIDVIVLVDWTQARITEGVYGKFVNLLKVPFTDAGIAIVEAEIRAVYDAGVANGGFTTDPAAVISVPKAASVSAADKADRILPDVTFTFYLAGAIHATTINGIVTV